MESIVALLKKKGKIIITTPNQENFKKAMVCCPNCGAFFHRDQHMTQWDVKKLKDFMSKFNRRSLLCKSTAFTGYPRLNFLYAWAHKFYYGYYPNLIYIGEKESTSRLKI